MIMSSSTLQLSDVKIASAAFANSQVTTVLSGTLQGKILNIQKTFLGLLSTVDKIYLSI